MFSLRFFLKCTKIRYILTPVIKLGTSIAFCQSYSKGKKKQDVYLFGSPLSLPEGSNRHSLFEGPNNWERVSFGPNFGVALDASGSVYLWGNTKDEEDGYVKPFLLCKVDGVVDCQCSKNDVYFLKKNGTVCIVREVNRHLEDQKRVLPEVLDGFSNNVLFNNQRIVKMSVGPDHAAFVSDDGSLCNNEYGQCGHKPSVVTNENVFLVYNPDKERTKETIGFNRVRFRERVRVKDVVCGANHTLCVDTDNNIYSFGDDSSIQLFLGDSRGRSLFKNRVYEVYLTKKYIYEQCPIEYGQEERHLQYVPVRINDLLFLSKFKGIVQDSTVKLAAGDGFTVITLVPKDKNRDESVILSSGKNNYGQCGSPEPAMYVPRRVRIPQGPRCRFVTCGSTHCMALAGEAKVWAWGGNNRNQINSSRKIINFNPEEVDLRYTPGSEGDLHVKYLRCAYNNSVIITQ